VFISYVCSNLQPCYYVANPLVEQPNHPIVVSFTNIPCSYFHIHVANDVFPI
jgi:hypothetical protein